MRYERERTWPYKGDYKILGVDMIKLLCMCQLSRLTYNYCALLKCSFKKKEMRWRLPRDTSVETALKWTTWFACVTMGAAQWSQSPGSCKHY